MKSRFILIGLQSVVCLCAMVAIQLLAGCSSSDTEPAQKFDKPAGVEETGTTKSLEDVIAKQRRDRDGDGLKSSKSKARR